MLEELNQEQRAAVTHGEGPLLIIAGAGTGKTKVLTSRILYLIQEKKVSPKNILALTFTEKATEEMMERIDLNLPLGYEEIWVKTFHGFCDAILKESGLEIGLDMEYKLLDQTEEYLFLKRNLFNLNLDYYRPLGHPGKFIEALLTHFSRLKDEDITPSAYLAYAAQSKLKGEKMTFQNTEEKKIFEEEAKKMLEVATVYEKYQKLLLENNSLNFGDLHYYLLRLLEKRPSLLKEYQERFTYILVDEYQDTNFAQNKLITLLAQKHRNIMVVGDDDQGIYRWRGATVNNILLFSKNFPEAKKIVLKNNYRSKQAILDFAYKVIINNNPHRLEAQAKIDKRLISMTEKELEKKSVEIKNFAHYLEESEFITQQIKSDVEKGNYNYSDFAILLRTNALAKPFAEYFRAYSLPYSVISGQGLLSKEVIKDLVSLIRFLSNLSDDVALFRVLSMPFFDLPMEMILEFLEKARRNNWPLWAIVKLQTDSPPTLFPDKIDHWQKGRLILSDLIDFSKNKSVSQVLGRFIYHHQFLKGFTKEENEANAEAIAYLSAFSEKVSEFEANNPDSSLVAFEEYLELLAEANSNLASIKLDKQENTVKIMTVHAAKGLEFPVVFIPALVNQRFPITNKKEAILVPDELLPETLPGPDCHIEEERRLFYVACTRAKEALYLSFSQYYEGKKKWRKSPFLEEGEGKKETSETKAPSLEQKKDLFFIKEKESHLQLFPKIKFTGQEKFSYSQFETFKTCPLQYKYRYLFKIPTPSPHAANFGSSVHNTLKDFYHLLQEGGSEKVSLEILHSLYEKNWIATGYESKAHENTRKKKGWEILTNFYEINSRPFLIPEYLEKNFSLKIGKVMVSGRIDRIDKLKNGTYEVIDYKTGRLKKESDLKKDLQLSLYALVLKELFELSVGPLSLYFLEDNKKISTFRTEQDLKTLKEEIEKIADEIYQSDFSPTPGFHCQFCDYSLICWAV